MCVCVCVCVWNVRSVLIVVKMSDIRTLQKHYLHLPAYILCKCIAAIMVSLEIEGL